MKVFVWEEEQVWVSYLNTGVCLFSGVSKVLSYHLAQDISASEGFPTTYYVKWILIKFS